MPLRGCLYGGEPARVPELVRLGEVNFTTGLYDTFEAGGLFAKAYFETRTGLGLELGLGPEENPDSGKTRTRARTRV